jgi:single-strand DNA-binding protein
MSTTVTLTGNLGSDPELRFTAKGTAVASFSMVTSKPVKGEDGKWRDEEETWWRVTAWDTLGQNCVDTLQKGDTVIVHGRAFLESYETKEGQSRSMLKVQAYTVGVSLKRVSAKLNRVERAKKEVVAVEDDPWASKSSDDIPPF